MHPRISFLRDTKQIGAVSERRAMAALAEAGYRFLVPYGEQCRYDIAIERDGQFQRVQVKTGRGSARRNAESPAQERPLGRALSHCAAPEGMVGSASKTAPAEPS